MGYEWACWHGMLGCMFYSRHSAWPWRALGLLLTPGTVSARKRYIRSKAGDLERRREKERHLMFNHEQRASFR